MSVLSSAAFCLFHYAEHVTHQLCVVDEAGRHRTELQFQTAGCGDGDLRVGGGGQSCGLLRFYFIFFLCESTPANHRFRLM